MMQRKGMITVVEVATISVLLFAWAGGVFAEAPRQGQSLQTCPGTSAMVISPDSKYLYLFHPNKIYQFELPALELVKSVKVEKSRRPKKGGEKDFVRKYDKDNDGLVSKEEFTGQSRLFDRLDQNKDGHVDESEASQGPPPRTGRGE